MSLFKPATQSLNNFCEVKILSKLNWKYSFINNLPYFVILAIYTISFPFTKHRNSGSLLGPILIFIIIWLGYYLLFQKKYWQKHPEANILNRKLTLMSWLISIVGAVGLPVYVLVTQSHTNFFLFMSYLLILLLIRDSFSEPKDNIC